jgi:hypothetical protein
MRRALCGRREPGSHGACHAAGRREGRARAEGSASYLEVPRGAAQAAAGSAVRAARDGPQPVCG